MIFASDSLDVSAECQDWTSRDAGAGYLWGYQPPGQALGATAVGICSLRDPTGRVTASVIEDTGFTPISAAQRAKSERACAGMLAGGWVPRTPTTKRGS